MEVCAVTRQGDVAFRLNPYPLHYQAAFAFSIFLYPPSISRSYVRPALLGGRKTDRAYRVPPE